MERIPFKVILIGDSGVGKTSVLRRYTENDFNLKEQATVGVDFRMKSCPIGHNSNAVTDVMDSDNPVHINFQIWDTAGQERFRSMTKVYFRAADVIIFVFDIGSHKTFDNLSVWLEMTNELARPGVLKYLVGNKTDKYSMQYEENDTATSSQNIQREVNYEQGLSFAKSHGMNYTECSAKTSTGVNEIFQDCANLLNERNERRKSLDVGNSSSHFDLNRNDFSNNTSKKSTAEARQNASWFRRYCSCS